jgi:predicted TIM-barrel fold metal-dependent hydrolase
MTVFGFGFEHRPTPPTSAELEKAWQPLIDTCIETIGTKRCMFESNFPVDKQSCSYVELWNAFKLATRAMSPDERADLFYRTACRTYRVPELAKLGDSLSA